MAQVPACSNIDRFGKPRLVTTVSKSSLNKYASFKEMTREMLRQRVWDTVDIGNITDTYKKNYIPSPELSPIERKDPYGPMNRFRPTPSPTINSRFQSMPMQTRGAVSFQGQSRLPEIRISPPSPDSLEQFAMVGRKSEQYPLRKANTPNTPDRLLTVAAPIPSRPLKKPIHITQSLIESVEEMCPDSCTKPPPRPPSSPPPSRRADQLMLRAPGANIQSPRRPHSPQTLAGITGNVNTLTATYPNRRESNTKDKKIVTEEVIETFDRLQDKQTNVCPPCPSKSPPNQSREPSTYVAVPYSKQQSLSSVDNSTSTCRRTVPAYQPMAENAGNLFASRPPAEFQERPSKVMRKKTIANRGSTRVVSQEVKKVYKTDRACTAVEDPNAEGTNKAAVIKIINLFLEIMSQLLKISSVKAL